MGLTQAQQAQILNQLAASGELSGLNPAILEGIDQEESGYEAKGAGINPQNYGGEFGLSDQTTYAGGATAPASLLSSDNALSFGDQATIAATDFAGLLNQYGGNVNEAESAYQTGSPTAEKAGTGGVAVVDQALGKGSAVSSPSIYDAISGLEAPTIAQYGQSTAAAQAGFAELPSQLALQGSQLAYSTELQQESVANQLAGNTL